MSRACRLGIAAVLLSACAREPQPAPATPAPAAVPDDDAPHLAPAAPATGARCPNSIAVAASKQGGACLEAAVLGPDVVAECSTLLERKGWQRDHEAETMIGGQTGKTLVCYYAP